MIYFILDNKTKGDIININKIFILGIIVIAYIVVSGHPLLITEVMPNPAGHEPDNEWIEIHNPTGTAYCIDAWRVGDQEGQWIIPNPTGGDDYVLYPDGYLTFANNADSFLAHYGYEPDLALVTGATSAVQITINGSVYLANTSDQVYLRDPSDSIIDCVQWGSTYETGADSIWYPLSASPPEGDPCIRNPQDAEGIETNGEVSEQLSSVWTTCSAISETFEGPNTGGFNPSGLSGLIISGLIHDPTSPASSENVQIRTKIKSDTILVFAYMIYTISDFSDCDTSNMIQLNDSIYIDTISAYPVGTRVKYYISASNANNDSTVSPLSAPIAYNEYIVSEGSNFYEVHFNKSTDQSVGILNFADPFDSLDWHMAKYIGSATKSVDACLYDLDRQIVADSLISAHNRGVNVRFITDADNSANAQVIELETAGIPVIDDAFPIGYGGSNIMHNKFVIIDTQTTLSGSYNVTDNGTDKNANNQVIINDILIAENYTKEFTEMWGSNTMTPNAANSKFAGSKSDNINHIFYIDEDTIEVYMSPSDGCASKIMDAIATADTSIYFCIYVFSSQSIADAMKDRHDNNGVTVRGVFDATFWNQDYSKSLDLRGDWNAGNDNNPWSPVADVFVDSVDGNLLHHKYMLIDADDWPSNPIVITGSYNWSAAAETGNDENVLIIHSSYFADLFLQEFAARYYEAGGSGSFTINTDIENIALNVFRSGDDVIIDYDIVKTGFSHINVYMEDIQVAASEINRGRLYHTNPEGGIYTVCISQENGIEREIGSFIIGKNNIFSFISENRLFSDKKIYRALIKSSNAVSAELYNIAGECIDKQTVASGTHYIAPNNLPAGIYYIKFISNNSELKDKIIKVR